MAGLERLPDDDVRGAVMAPELFKELMDSVREAEERFLSRFMREPPLHPTPLERNLNNLPAYFPSKPQVFWTDGTHCPLEWDERDAKV